ncbi:DUF2927 domain-containing protein [Acuticoccus mangrovi]|uniref:DUF2927 domain-containing protein n=1 Tax=Acuticoccus mangrovi TaxID=2796142 RepID=A0A934IMG3_9HYPH|nr:DUF2927 domain-containing protein [Acuticoccus mangrovi]MBJ3775131.1 DUF2927 domain-containing protein [Acuticoccus mangrovi]
MGTQPDVGPCGRSPICRRRRLPTLLVALLVCAAALFAAADAEAIDAPFSDEELITGFVLTVFGAEADDGSGTATRRVKKFTGPVHFHIVSTSAIDRRRTVRTFVRSLSESVDNLELVETGRFEDADMVIFLVNRVDYVPTIRRTVWEGADTAFLEKNACSAVLAARRSGIERAYIYLVADEGFAGLSHCMVEEIAQSLGPANDSSLLDDSIFNDMSELNAFGLFDWFILNMLYDDHIEPGMSEAEVLPLLPGAIAAARDRLTAVVKMGLAGHDAAPTGRTLVRH